MASEALEILDRRLAKGEITEDEYERRKELIKGDRGYHGSFSRKVSQIIMVSLAVIGIVSLFNSVGGFAWSTFFENLLTAYRAFFHSPIDWSFRWIGIQLPPVIKDGFIVFGSSFLALNLMALQELGQSYLQYKPKSKNDFFSHLNKLVILYVSGPYLSICFLMDGDNPRLRKMALVHLKIWGYILSLVILLLGVNFTFFKLGL